MCWGDFTLWFSKKRLRISNCNMRYCTSHVLFANKVFFSNEGGIDSIRMPWGIVMTHRSNTCFLSITNMSEQVFSCFHCKEEILTDDSQSGTIVQCPFCEELVSVPTPPPPIPLHARNGIHHKAEQVRVYLESKIGRKYKVFRQGCSVFVNSHALAGCCIKFQSRDSNNPMLVEPCTPSQPLAIGSVVVLSLLAIGLLQINVILAGTVWLGGNFVRSLPMYRITKEVKRYVSELGLES